MTERRFYQIALGVVALFAVGLLVLCVWQRAERTTLLAEMQAIAQAPPTTATGGAETVTPRIVPVAQWRFPLADEDYLALTSPYGYRVSPLLHVEAHHDGLDIAGVWRAQVVAVADGQVVEHWPPPDGYWRGHDVLGGMVRIRHADGTQTLYAHLSWTRVHTGDRVRAGQVIGRVGDTGKSDGQHLHFEVISPTDDRLNPLLYVRTPHDILE